jgi:hypothetical protein
LCAITRLIFVTFHFFDLLWFLLYFLGYTDAASVRTPSFLSGGTFHFPDDAEAAVKWLRGRAHELGRVRRAFEYTLIEVEAKWKANFAKMETLMHARQHEIATLQRRLLTALGQTESVTGTLRWK